MYKGFSLLIILVFMLISVSVNAEVIDRIAAIAGDEIITVNDLRNEGKIRYLSQGRRLSAIDESSNAAMEIRKLTEALVQSKLIERKANRMNVPIGKVELERHLKEMYSQSGQSEEDYKQYLSAEGISWSDFQRFLLNELRAQFVLRSELAAQVSVSESDVIACAKQKTPSEENSVSLEISQILFPKIESMEDIPEESGLGIIMDGLYVDSLALTRGMLADDLQGYLSENPDRFVEAVRYFSSGKSVEQDGLLGSFNPGELANDFNEVFTLEAGEISKVINTSVGMHIIKVNSKKEGESQAWKRSVELCRSQLMESESQQLIQSWLNNLSESNFVSIKVLDDIRSK